MIDSNAKSHPSQSAAPSRETVQDPVEHLKSRIQQLEKTVEALESRLQDTEGRYVAVCPACQTRFDMLAHHYSIGLFDNLVYIKCPKCQKTLPLKGGTGGDVKVVAD